MCVRVQVTFEILIGMSLFHIHDLQTPVLPIEIKIRANLVLRVITAGVLKIDAIYTVYMKIELRCSPGNLSITFSYAFLIGSC